MIKFIAALMCLIIPVSSFAQTGKVSVMKATQKAPYDGFLFDSVAYATIEADKGHIIELCNLDKDIIVKKCEAAQKYIVDTCTNEKETLKTNYEIQLDAKNREIDRLMGITLTPKPSRGLWLGVGVGIGIILGAGIAIGATNSL